MNTGGKLSNSGLLRTGRNAFRLGDETCMWGHFAAPPAMSGRRLAAFTLIEVMIAGGILFMCLFAILALVANALRNARLLQTTKDDPIISAAAEAWLAFSSTNGDISRISGEFQGLSWDAESTPLTNGLYVVDLVMPAQRGANETRMQFLVFNSKQSQPGMGRRPR